MPSVFVLLYIRFNKTILGGDHFHHLKLIDAIKANGHRFLHSCPVRYNRKYFSGPQLFHWIISFLPQRLYSEKFVYINLTVKSIEIVAFNIFLFFLYQRLQFNAIIFLYANIVVNIFPFCYAIWNAKNVGLSARGIGLGIGQIYTYFLFAYILSGNMILFITLFVITFIIMLLSQMAMQYVLLTLPFFTIIFNISEIVIIPFLAYGLFYLIMPRVAKNYIVGQFNHKRNYALFIADIYILKRRPSIYRDFIYDFWIKLKENKLKGLRYISQNPLLEIIYGLPFLWFVLYTGYTSGLSEELEIIYYIILCALGIFFLTSFKITRFLGEPQRYLEFVVPLITVIFVLNYSWQYHVVIILFSLSIIFINNYYNQKYASSGVSSNVLFEYLKKEKGNKGYICVSNRSHFLRKLPVFGIDALTPDYSKYYKNKAEFNNYFCNDLFIISPFAIKEYIKEYSPQLLVLYTEFYSIKELTNFIKEVEFRLIKTFNKYEVYDIYY